MSRDKGPWDDARRAWDRLTAWRGDQSGAASGGALAALRDIGELRRLLDQVELLAVRAARGRKKSWAEIATQLGVTRQSAWERWRDLDDDLPTTAPDDVSPSRVTEPENAADDEPGLASYVEHSVAGYLDEALNARLDATLDEKAAHERRRRSSVTVPNVVGMSLDAAREALRKKGLTAMGADPDAAPLDVVGWRDSVVTDQSPESGASVPNGSVVRLWIRRGGGGSAGVREPRRPGPSPLSAREMRYERSDEAVG